MNLLLFVSHLHEIEISVDTHTLLKRITNIRRRLKDTLFHEEDGQSIYSLVKELFHSYDDCIFVCKS